MAISATVTTNDKIHITTTLTLFSWRTHVRKGVLVLCVWDLAWSQIFYRVLFVVVTLIFFFAGVIADERIRSGGLLALGGGDSPGTRSPLLLLLAVGMHTRSCVCHRVTPLVLVLVLLLHLLLLEVVLLLWRWRREGHLVLLVVLRVLLLAAVAAVMLLVLVLVVWVLKVGIALSVQPGDE